MNARRRVKNVNNLLQTALEEKDFYNALQYYKTIISKKVNSEDYDGAEQMYLESIKVFCDNNELPSAFELSNNYLQLLKDRKIQLDPTHTQQVLTIISSFPSCDYRFQVSKNFTLWSREVSSTIGGNPDFNLQTGIYLWKEKQNYNEANNFMLYCQNSEEYASFLYDWCLTGYQDEYDLYITRTILFYLSKGNMKMANEVFKSIQKKLNLETPLAHFCEFLLATLERDAYPLFKLLREQYASELQRDPSFSSYMDKIAQYYFNIRNYSSDLFSNMFNMFKNMN